MPDDKSKPPKLRAAIRVSNLLFEDNFGPGVGGDDLSSDTVDAPYRLTHLELLANTAQRGIPVSLPMTILAAFAVSTPALSAEMGQIDQASANAGKYTMLTTWEIQQKQASLSNCFDNMNSKSKSVTSVVPRVSNGVTVVRKRKLT